MNKILWMGAVATSLAVALLPMSADAKRLGSGKSAGMQRVAPAKPAQPPAAAPAQTATNATNTATNPATTPATPNNAATAAAVPAAGAAAAAAPKRSWLGPIAGLAAGIGLAALIGHLGLGGEVANFLMLALLLGVAFFGIRFLLRRWAGSNARPGLGQGGLAYAGQGAAGSTAGTGPARSPVAYRNAEPQPQTSSQPVQLPASSTPTLPDSAAAQWGLAGSHAAAVVAGPVTTGAALPADFDHVTFERVAKMIFIRMQAANDAADLKDLRNFTTPELFAALRLDLQERGDRVQHTDVVSVEATVLDYAEEDGRQIVSVNFKGLVREEPGAEPEPYDEVWHLVKPVDGSQSWAIAGVQQRH